MAPSPCDERTLGEGRFFLCHSSADRDFATWLAAELEASRVPVWYSDWEIRVGDSIVEKVETALEDMAGLVVLLSVSSLRSKWVREELNAAIARRLAERNIQIFPVRLDESAIPPLLSHLKYADFARDRGAGLRELIEALVPSALLVGRIRELKAECCGLLDSLMRRLPDDAEVGGLVGRINALLERAVEARYAIEIRGGRVDAMKPAGFFEEFDHLVERGYDLRDPSWGALVLLRNIYAHEMKMQLSLLVRGAEVTRMGHSEWWSERLIVTVDRIRGLFDELLKQRP